jgi:hypothetical protein
MKSREAGRGMCFVLDGFWIGGALGKRSMWHDCAVIIAANLASFGLVELLNAGRRFGLFGQLELATLVTD